MPSKSIHLTKQLVTPLRSPLPHPQCGEEGG